VLCVYSWCQNNGMLNIEFPLRNFATVVVNLIQPNIVPWDTYNLVIFSCCGDK
jgi:hypothetical protein